MSIRHHEVGSMASGMRLDLGILIWHLKPDTGWALLRSEWKYRREREPEQGPWIL